MAGSSGGGGASQIGRAARPAHLAPNRGARVAEVWVLGALSTQARSVVDGELPLSFTGLVHHLDSKPLPISHPVVAGRESPGAVRGIPRAVQGRGGSPSEAQ